MTEHSKLLWSIFEDKDGFEIITDDAEVHDGARWSCSELESDGHVAYASKFNNKNAKVDAQLIVDSVNNAQRYKKALEAFLPFKMKCDIEQLHGGDRDLQQAILNAEKALKESDK